MPVTTGCSTMSSSSQIRVPGPRDRPGSSKDERTKVGTLCTIASSTERTCRTLAPREAISSISSKAMRSKPTGLGSPPAGRSCRRRRRRCRCRSGPPAPPRPRRPPTCRSRRGPAWRCARSARARPGSRRRRPPRLAQSRRRSPSRRSPRCGRRRARRMSRPDLPALPGARRHAGLLQRDRQEPRRHLLAGGDDGIVLARIVEARCALDPGHEFIGLAGHRRHHHRHLVTRVDLALHMAGDVADAFEIGDGRAAKLHDETGHFGRELWKPRRKARLHGGVRAARQCRARARADGSSRSGVSRQSVEAEDRSGAFRPPSRDAGAPPRRSPRSPCPRAAPARRSGRSPPRGCRSACSTPAAGSGDGR